MKRSKRYLENIKKIDLEKDYSLNEALEFISDSSNTKFDQTVDLSINLGVILGMQTKSLEELFHYLMVLVKM